LAKKSNWGGFVDAAGFWNQYQNMMEFTFGSFGDPTDPKVKTLEQDFLLRILEQLEF
jgi:hypothetical protein